MLDTPVTLSTATLRTLLARREGEPHPVLTGVPAWSDDTARQGEDERANAELDRLGLTGPRGIDPDLKAVLEVLARPRVEFYGWINGGYDGAALNYTLLAGATGGVGFVLAHQGEQQTVALGGVRPEQLLDGFLHQLPALRPGRGETLVVPTADVTNTRRTTNPTSEFGVGVLRDDRRTGPGPADEARRVLGLRRLGGGSLYVAVRDRGGRRQRIPRPVNYVDTVEGRWLTEQIVVGEPCVALTPAPPALLAERLRRAQTVLDPDAAEAARPEAGHSIRTT